MTDILNSLVAKLERAPVVPLIQSDDPAGAVELMHALARGGLGVVEVVLRTQRAYDVVKTLAEQSGDVIVGAGTVLSPQHARDAVDAGARFLVSPGLHEDVVETAYELGVPILPGVATASEAQRAWNLGLRNVKFFPASQAGGPSMIRALASVFSDLRFMPTGGISVGNLPDYLAIKAVLACGGSWLTPADAVRAGAFDVIERLAGEALQAARTVRPDVT